jgi:hypothetical protein
MTKTETPDSYGRRKRVICGCFHALRKIRRQDAGAGAGHRRKHFPFSISHFSFFIACIVLVLTGPWLGKPRPHRVFNGE